MKDGNHYMNELRKTKNLKSFNEAGRFLGITSTAVSLIRRGGGISEETAIKLGKALDIDPGVIYADINAAKATDSQVKNFWLEVSKHLGTAATIAIIALPLVFSNNSSAEGILAKPNTVYYVKSIRLKLINILNKLKYLRILTIQPTFI